MEKQQKEQPEYPTRKQIKESFQAYKTGGQEGILKFLQEQRRKREAETSKKE